MSSCEFKLSLGINNRSFCCLMETNLWGRRYAVCVPVRLANLAEKCEVIEGETQDISAKGMKIILRKGIDLGERLRYEITFRNDQIGLLGARACGKAWVIRQQTDNDGNCVMTVRTKLSCMADLLRCEKRCAVQWVSTGKRAKALAGAAST